MKRSIKRFLLGTAGVMVTLYAFLVIVALANAEVKRDRLGGDSYRNMNGFIVALKAYQTEYGHFPIDALSSTDPHKWYRTQGAIMKVLMGKDNKINPRQITFYDPPKASGLLKKVNGLLYDEHHEPVLVDSWGEPFYFEIDLTARQEVPDPGDPAVPPRLIQTNVIIFSAGPDRDPNTWLDNVASWR